jgi:hypothetical protein
MKPHIVTITAYARPVRGIFTHRVVTPCLRAGTYTMDLADARTVARGFQPADGRPVEIREVAPRPRKTLGLRLTR